MPTQEERLAALERTTTEHIQKTNENLAMTIGLVQLQTFDLKKISQRLDEMHESLQNSLNIHRDATNAHFDHLQKQVDQTNTSLESLQEHADKTDTRMDSIETQLTNHTTLLQEILARLPEKS